VATGRLAANREDLGEVFGVDVFCHAIWPTSGAGRGAFREVSTCFGFRSGSRPLARLPQAASGRRDLGTVSRAAAPRRIPEMIDLHLHTNASDGRHPPEELVARAAAAGIRTMSVTDHDTMAAVPVAAGLELVPGIEMTAVDDGRDLHVLGYFLDPDSPELRASTDVRR